MFAVELNSNMALAAIVPREHLVCSSICCLNPLLHRRVPMLTKQGRLPLPLVQNSVPLVFVSVVAYSKTNTLSNWYIAVVKQNVPWSTTVVKHNEDQSWCTAAMRHNTNVT